MIYDSTCYNVVSLSEIKSHCKIDTSDDDTLLTIYRNACVDWAEDYLNRYLISRNVVEYFESLTYNTNKSLYPFIQISSTPLKLLEGVYSMIDGVYSRVSSDYYSLEQSDSRPRIHFYTLPNIDSNESQPYQLQYIAGYTETPEDVPSSIRAGLLCHIAYLYENRGDTVSDGGVYAPRETYMLYNKFRNLVVF